MMPDGSATDLPRRGIAARGLCVLGYVSALDWRVSSESAASEGGVTAGKSVSREHRRRSDETSREQLAAAYRAHSRPLLRLATLMSRNAEEAQDAMQEAYLRSMKRLPSLPESAVLPYLRRALVNVCLSRLRRAELERRFLAKEQDSLMVPPPFEDHDVIWAAVTRLPTRQRACVVLRYFEDLSQADVAAVLRCSVGTVRSQTSKAIGRLRKELADEFGRPTS